MSEASFIYLSQEDAVACGAADVSATVADTERTTLLAYQGKAIEAPTATLFWGVPAEKLKNFVGYPSKKRANIHAGYIDDDGVEKVALKNIPSNPDNPANNKGPRASGLVTMLDPETGYPISVMDAMVISCMRTGALGAIGVKHLRRANSSSVGLIGVGPINQAALACTAEVMPELKTAFVYDFKAERAAAFASEYSEKLGIDVVPVKTAREAVADADVVIPATNVQTIDDAYIDEDWMKRGSLLVDLSIWDATWDTLARADRYVMNSELSLERKTMTPHVLVSKGIAKESDILDLGKVIAGQAQGRENDDDIIVYFARGMAIYDVMCGYRVYETALQKGIGQTLDLWKAPFWS
ncbi:hypothetical protein [Aquamicrobium sp. LC103]|uniref:hypothetical protein n=1 Tax=Aquamicrobium sp. LC103 TaxID=1120658 RepID=UPI00063EBA99|nr:hypothetical protein [Aquamicrobium sp. LC103]TKT78292.1 hypothetical protein XW59_011750 [Aquamicrobium sp. LC103]